MKSLDFINPLALITSIRNLSFDFGILKQSEFSKPIISVGNITMGGSGKTPVVIHLAKWALANGMRPAIVSRGYGRDTKGIFKVDRLSPDGDSLYGDEPFFIAQKLPTVPVYVGEKRIEAVAELIKRETVDFILADDAYQHRYLKRAVNIAVVDAMEPLSNYQVFPFGRGREPIKGLSRADFIILNKVNMVNEEQLNLISKKIKKYIKTSKIISSQYIFSEFYAINSDDEFDPELKTTLVSGVARPESVEKLLTTNGYKFVEHNVFKDHHPYSLEDIRNIEIVAKSRGVSQILCTEKDSVKIEKFRNELDLSWFNFSLRLDTSCEIEGVYEEIRKHTS